ncbi:bifunctional metallophosphatase/5'-nucleotidase [Bacillus alkalicellulosilyticus]|uniref:bifunctional metallophosphatase/5'-nucleotidase n=1 Tax=Alkalihalobacterium alkalicellulosilyticum TaxID=1912214 RepID=UPI001483B854|nr:bifunctional UDP-sugar hydrolase/5'-nucleotidase [Bacillus alkalicellulosilyticus]
MSYKKSYIYHTNDLHSEFTYWPNVTAYIEKQREKHQLDNEDYLYFDIGDHSDRCHPITEATEGKANVRLLNQSKVDAVTIGNNEGITFSREQLDCLYEDRQFDVLLANLKTMNGERPEWVKSYRIDEMAGVKVAFIGVTIPYYPLYETLDWKIEDPFELLPSILKDVKQEADVVVLLSHLGLDKDQELVEKIDGIDLILGAHTHNLLPTGMKVKNTLICQAGKLCHHVGKVALTIDEENKKIKGIEASVVDIRNHDRSEDTEQLLATLERETKKWLETPIATLHTSLTTKWYEESAGPLFLAELLKEWCKTDISMVNAGVLLGDVPEGEVTRKMIHSLCPHPINPCTVEIEGRFLQEAIEKASTTEIEQLHLKGLGFRGKVIGKMVYSGIEVKINPSPIGEKQIEAITILGEPIQKNQIYKIATLDMFTFGRLYPSITKAKQVTYFMPELLRDLITWKLAQE